MPGQGRHPSSVPVPGPGPSSSSGRGGYARPGARYGPPPHSARMYMVGDDRKLYAPPNPSAMTGSLSWEEIAYKTRSDHKFQVR